MQHECSIIAEHSRYEAAIRDYEKSQELEPNDKAICLLYLILEDMKKQLTI